VKDSKTETIRVCPACGTTVSNAGLRSCPVCDKLLTEEYQPLDTIRSAYRMQQKRLIRIENSQQNLFEQNKNHVSHTAWACVVYSLVPYLGMLFIPVAFITGGVGYYISLKRPQLGGGRLAAVCVTLSFLILGVQVLLWWLLYLVPRLNVPSN
jgi:hypothetical protein